MGVNSVERVDSVEGETTYQYDKSDRLLESTANGVLTTYEYDDNGNLTSQTLNGKETTYTWDYPACISPSSLQVQ